MEFLQRKQRVVILQSPHNVDQPLQCYSKVLTPETDYKAIIELQNDSSSGSKVKVIFQKQAESNQKTSQASLYSGMSFHALSQSPKKLRLGEGSIEVFPQEIKVDVNKRPQTTVLGNPQLFLQLWNNQKIKEQLALNTSSQASISVVKKLSKKEMRVKADEDSQSKMKAIISQGEKTMTKFWDHTDSFEQGQSTSGLFNVLNTQKKRINKTQNEIQDSIEVEGVNLQQKVVINSRTHALPNLKKQQSNDIAQKNLFLKSFLSSLIETKTQEVIQGKTTPIGSRKYVNGIMNQNSTSPKRQKTMSKSLTNEKYKLRPEQILLNNQKYKNTSKLLGSNYSNSIANVA